LADSDGRQAREDLLQRRLALRRAVVGEGEVVELRPQAFDLLGQLEHALIGDFLGLDAFGTDVQEREGSEPVGADGRQVGRAGQVLEGERVFAGLDRRGEVAHDLGAVAVDRDGGDLGVGGRDFGRVDAEGKGGQQEAGGAGHGDGFRMSASRSPYSLKERSYGKSLCHL
jgi:hypothetical protein